jgi:hypothetical protein
MGELNPGGFGFRQMQFVLEVFVHHVNEAVANSPQQK